MNGILRGTTPDFIIKIKKTDFNVTDVTKLELICWNSYKTVKYGLTDVTVDAEENTFSVHFGEQFTLSLDASKKFHWQMRCMFSDGNIVGTKQSEPIDVEPLRSRDVMST